MGTRLEWISHAGDSFDLISPVGDYEVAFLVGDGLEQLVGVVEDEPVEVPGVPGGVFRPRDRRVAPLEGVLDCALVGESQWSRFRRAFSTTREGSLRLSTGGSVFVLPCRLSAPLPSPGLSPRPGTIVPVSLVADGGVWCAPVSGGGRGEVSNFGDVDLAVAVRWSGAGGRVVLPSGFSFTLPAVDGERVLRLDPRFCHAVYTTGGVVDRAASLAVGAVGEVVPPGESGVFEVPEGAVLSWNVGVFDPWT